MDNMQKLSATCSRNKKIMQNTIITCDMIEGLMQHTTNFIIHKTRSIHVHNHVHTYLNPDKFN